MKITEYKKLIRYYAESNCHLSENEILELAGALLWRDISLERYEKIQSILENDYFAVWELLAKFAFYGDDNSIYDLTKGVKDILSNFYKDEIKQLIKDEMELIKEEPTGT